MSTGFLLTRERLAVTGVVAWAASNGDRSENADYQYGKRRHINIRLPLALFK
jgi:transcription elongation GreA/GreB family factor